MIVVSFRQSSLNTYSWCPFQFYLLTLGFPSISNKAATRGNIFHKTFEILAQVKKARQEGKDSYEDEVFGHMSIDECEPKILTDLSFKYYQKIESELDLNKKDLKICHELTTQALAYKDGMFDPRRHNVFKIELKFDFPIEKDWAYYQYQLMDGSVLEGQLYLRGTIDLITKPDDSGKTLEMIDWKTGKRLNWATEQVKDLKSHEEDVQLKLYHYALNHLFPEIERVVCTIFYVTDGGPYTVVFDKSQIPKTEQFLKDKLKEIQNIQNPKRDLTWKCSKICSYGLKGGEFIDKEGNRTGMTTCDYLHKQLQKDGIDVVTLDYLNKKKLSEYTGGGRHG